ncbi:hypothetical protein [Phyllobacterium myrsinacearum]|uniref:Uncharacterized protein n=1 Tax=Phyllobacterium myrsinacearum TaxID=28101 RepID=A0A2S9JA70_9HYPH|nr:hypothetical protein [Phyllobacterium myrsinacearum]PRD49672.1 hypothetical protein C5750_24945 [Phyllobacterium myrsinacearum]PWV94744.1 hypothetical protein DEV92_102197 [Phyllobacterium myrsinacearum]RZV07147.1 hypothetical protein EV654_1816 [Phyllobacterium myrsinacearum]
MLAEVMLPLKLTFRLWLKYWPQLFAVVLLGVIASHMLMQLAVDAAYINHYAGLAVLTLVALAQLVTTVSMIQIVRPGLPALNAAQEKIQTGNDSGDARGGFSGLAAMVSVALIPFFAYYAAWGFLGNTVRQYSRTALAQMPFGESGGNVLDVLDSRWLLLSVAISWIIRKLAKAMKEKTGRSIWQIIMVVCETNWVFIGLFIISRWKDSWMKALSEGNLWTYIKSLLAGLPELVASAHSAALIPVEQVPETFGTVAIGLFFYALIPVIWLVMVALVYGYNVRDEKELLHLHRRFEQFGTRYASIPKFLRDFIEHFIGGYRSRYLPIANGVKLTLNSGLLLILTLILGYRFIEWAAAWMWLGTARLIGPHSLDIWQALSNGVSFLFGSPLQDSSTGILVEPLRICFLAAILETAFSMRRNPQSVEAQPAAASS